jgi:CRP-like cAMP-binding protein
VILSDGELVDPTVARALPLLTYRQMMDVTKKIKRAVYQPGEMILRSSQHVEDFFMIVRGAVEIIAQEGKACQGRVLARMESGDFFGEIELLGGEKSIACVRAAPDRAVELISLPRADFLRLIKESPLTEDALARIVRHRLEEHHSGASSPARAGKGRR